MSGRKAAVVSETRLSHTILRFIKSPIPFGFEGIQKQEESIQSSLLHKKRTFFIVAASDSQLPATRVSTSTPFAPLRRQLQYASRRTAPKAYCWLKASGSIS